MMPSAAGVSSSVVEQLEPSEPTATGGFLHLLQLNICPRCYGSMAVSKTVGEGSTPSGHAFDK